MQRAANTNSPRVTTPLSEPALKRRKTDHTTTPDSSTPTTPVSEPRLYVDRADIRAATKAQALADELAANRRALQGFANNTTETQWVLNVNVPGQLNGSVPKEDESMSEDEEDEWSATNGRQTYGSFKRTKAGLAASSTKTTPKSKSAYDDDFPDGSSDDGELDSNDSGSESRQNSRNNASAIDYENEDSLAALDRVDLSKSNYARAKKAGLPNTGAKPVQKQTFNRNKPAQSNHPRGRRGESHPKGKKKKGDKGGKKKR